MLMKWKADALKMCPVRGHARRFVPVYLQKGGPNERFGAMMRRPGIEYMKKELQGPTKTRIFPPHTARI